jgi:hypothetical protein
MRQTMTRSLAFLAALAPGAALAHEIGFAHGHPHGLELLLGVAAVVGIAFLAWRMLR